MSTKYTVKTARAAEKDILSIFEFILRDKPEAALRWHEEVQRQIASLEKFPERCPVIPEAREAGKEYRHILYRDYRTIFRIKGFTVYIMRVVHGAQLLDMSVLEAM